MKRKRHETRGEARFLTFCCFRRLPLLADAAARDLVVDHLALCRDRLGFALYAFVVMPDHVHLLLLPDTEVADVRRILSALKTRTAAKLLAQARLAGPAPERFWQAGGGYDRNVHSQKEFMEKLEYIEDNPVRKGLAPRPEDYRWSSAGSDVLGRDSW